LPRAGQASMPVNALQHVEVDFELSVANIATKLMDLAREPADESAAYPISEELEIEHKIANESTALRAGALKLGEFSPFTCPECHGTLMQIKDGSLVRFRCHAGHAYSPESLLATMEQVNEDALWNAVRSIKESVLLLKHLSGHAEQARANSPVLFRLKPKSCKPAPIR
jgi:two-component system, chemotaxis family, protein-glutamate methylesterase/glutaminase